MKSVLYRIAAVLLVLFAIGHTLGFRQDVPEWGATSVIRAMQATRFDAQGFNGHIGTSSLPSASSSRSSFYSRRQWHGNSLDLRPTR